MPRALLIEDEYEPRLLAVRALEVAGYSEVRVAQSRAEVLAIPEADLAQYELFVVDRNIPNVFGELPDTSVGDRLVEELVALVPDRVFVVFTGVPDKVLYQGALVHALPLVVAGPEGTFGRMHVLEKKQAVEFLQRISELKALLDTLDLVVVETSETLSTHLERLVRMYACRFDGTRVVVTRLGGGKSGAGVWKCSVFDSAGRPKTNHIAKESRNLTPVGSSSFVGLQSIAPSSLVAAFVVQISGLAGGNAIDIFQAAGPNSISIWELETVNARSARDAYYTLSTVLHSLASTSAVSITLRQLLESFVSWDEAQKSLGDRYRVKMHDRMSFDGMLEEQHGDLHGGNILVDSPSIALIDFDRQAISTRTVDPVTLLLSHYLHPDSPGYGTDSPTPRQLVRIARGKRVDGIPFAESIEVLQEWLATESHGIHDRWGAVLGYCLRQLRWAKPQDQVQLDRIDALVRYALKQLRKRQSNGHLPLQIDRL